jgi:hypothetical protein
VCAPEELFTLAQLQPAFERRGFHIAERLPDTAPRTRVASPLKQASPTSLTTRSLRTILDRAD